MEWQWTLAHPLHDVEDVVKMAQTYQDEMDSVIRCDPAVMRKNVTLASTYQIFDKQREFLAVCREVETDRLLGYCWYDRYGYTSYSTEEICNAKFHHIDLALPAKTRIRLLNEMIDQQVLWAGSNGIPIVCSTSIRGEHEVFMKVHAKRGFLVKGSYAWCRTEKALEGMKNV